MSATLEQIVQILETELHLKVADAETDVVAEGLLDSLALVDLMLQLEMKNSSPHRPPANGLYDLPERGHFTLAVV